MIRIQEILDKVAAKNKDANLELIQKAYVFAAAAHAGQTRLSGEPYLSHPLAVADTLADMGFDEPTVAAGLLHDTVEDTSVTIDDIAENFGDEVADIVDGVTKISKIVFENKEEAQAENIRKMILAMSHDMRVIMVKLADRLHNMRTLDFQKAYKQKRIAQETMDIYAPLANRLGLYNIMRDLEDLSFKYLRPDVYSQITKWLEDHQVVAVDEIHEPVFLRDAPRPRPGCPVPELFGFPDPPEGIAEAGVDERVDPLENPAIRGLPVRVILPGRGIPRQAHLSPPG